MKSVLQIGGDRPRESLEKWAFRGALSPNLASCGLGRDEHVRLDLGLHAIDHDDLDDRPCSL